MESQKTLVNAKHSSSMSILKFIFMTVVAFCLGQMALAEIPTAQPIAATPDLDCASSDIKCLGRRAYAEAMCSDLLEEYLSEQQQKFKWVSKKGGLNFTHLRWLNNDYKSGQTTYSGNKIMVLTSTGGWVNYRYQCDIDSDGEYILGVKFEPSKPPKAGSK